MPTPAACSIAVRIECDFRHGLAEPAITHEGPGPVLSLVHGQTSLSIALHRATLGPIGLHLD